MLEQGHQICIKCHDHIRTELATIYRPSGSEYFSYFCKRCLDNIQEIEKINNSLDSYYSEIEIERQRKAAKDASDRARKTRSARVKIGGKKYTPSHIRYLLKMQKSECSACGANISSGYHVDHIYSLKDGGSNGPENIQLLCQTCNTRKGAMNPIMFLRKHKLRMFTPV